MPRYRYILSVTLAYLILGIAWILLSDQLLTNLPNIDSLVWLSNAKGVFFIIATTGFFAIVLTAVPNTPQPEQSHIAPISALTQFIDKPRPWSMYVFAIVLTVAMLWFRAAIDVPFEQQLLLILFMPAVIISALLGGLGPGLTSTVLSVLVIDYWFIPPQYSFKIASALDRMQFGVFVLSAVSVSWLAGRLKTSLQAAQTNRNMLQAIVEGTSDAVFIKDRQGRYLLANTACCQFIGKSSAEVIGYTDSTLFPAATEQEFTANDRAAMMSGKPVLFAELLKSLDGRILDFQTIKGPVHDQYGLTVGVFAVARNVTEQKRLENLIEQQQAKLAVSETRYRQLYEQSPIALCTCDHTGQMLSLNHEFQKLFGYTVEEIPSMAAWLDKVLGEAEQWPFSNEWRRPGNENPADDFATLQTESKVRSKQGDVKAVLVNRVRLGDEVLLAVQDITRRKQDEQALQESQERLQILIDHAPAALAMFDRDMRYLAVSRRWLSDYKLDDRMILGLEHYAVFPEIGETWKSVHRRGLAGEVIRNDEDCFIRSNGHRQWLKWEVRPWYGRIGDIEGIVIFSEDITERKAAEDERYRWSEAIRQSAAPNVIGSINGTIEFVNTAFLNLFGYKEDEVCGRHASFLTNDDPEVIAQQTEIIQSAKNNGFCAREVVRKTKSGDLLPVFLTVSTIRDTEDKLLGLMTTIFDLREIKAKEAELEQHRLHLESLVEARTKEVRIAEQRYRQVVESTAAGILELDPNGLVSMANPSAAGILGYPAEVLLDQNIHDLIHYQLADGSPCYADQCPLFNSITTGIKLHLDNEIFWRADGRAIPVSVATHPIWNDDSLSGSVMSFFDISERVMADQVREEARQAAEQLAQIKSDFLANMSHEIRTPLNGVLGLAHIGFRESAGNSEIQAIFSRILDSGKLLLTIINDILDFSKIEAGKLEIEHIPLDPGYLVDQLEQMFTAAIATKGLKLLIHKNNLPKHCLGDPVRISQILINLTSNAIKFTHAGEIKICTESENNQLIFKIIDTGIGMSEKDRTRLFAAFEQADSATTRKYGGTGLGLSISQRLAILMGGRLEVESQLGQGSTFTLRLPLLKTDQDVSPVVKQSLLNQKRLSGLRILAAEDNSINQLVLEDFLCQEGALVQMVGNGREAVLAVQQAPQGFDLVLMDVQMPELDGCEATQQIKRLVPSLPVIGQTAHALKEEHLRCLSVGMDAMITKPIDIEMLVEVVLDHVVIQANQLPELPGIVEQIMPTSRPLVDWQALNKKFPDRAGFVNRLVQMSIGSLESDLVKLPSLLEAENLTELAKLTHNLKGLAGNICAAELESIALDLMRAARANDVKGFQQGHQLIEAMQRVIVELKQGCKV